MLLATERDGAVLEAWRAGDAHPALGLFLQREMDCRPHEEWSSVLPEAEMLVALLLCIGLVPIERARPHAGRWLPVQLVVAFFYLNLYAAQASIAYARSRGEHLW